LQRIKIKWAVATTAPATPTQTELVKKPKHLLEYVVHKSVHLLESIHSDFFLAILDKHYPTWREARAELNELPFSGGCECVVVFRIVPQENHQ
jgi:predicted metal-dependent hydrolase